ncbi:MAG: Fic family protein [Candidatus Lokiarchaeota archaeon]|nr:Fic family protein [Candidatus Lokiarchaeota archaeon]
MNKFEAETPYNELPLIPPSRAKYESIKLWKQESNARSAIAELKGIANIIPNQAILINAIVIKESQDSSEVENIITTQDKLYQAMSVSKNIDSETKEVMFYREALYAGWEKVKNQGFISINDIIAIQKILIQNDAGIRKTPGTALVNDKTGEIMYSPPDTPETLNKLLKNLTEYLNEGENSLIKIGIIHYQFESIHPFYDGNGRTGRIINILYLLLKKYLEIPILYLSSFIIKNKTKYYELLRNVTKNDEWEEWILFILKGIEITSKETIVKIKQIKSLIDKNIEYIKEKLPKIYSKELVELLFENPYCKVEFLVNGLGIERKAASRYLHQLSEIKILELKKIGRENIFINKKLMEILKK